MYYRIEVNHSNIGVVLQTPFGLNPTRVRYSNNPAVWHLLSTLVDISLNNNFSLFNVCNAAVEQNIQVAEYLPGIWEVLFEKARPKDIPLSRTGCTFFFTNKEDAEKFQSVYPGMEMGILCEVEVIKEDFSLMVDMNWLDAIDENTATAGEALEAFRKYWAGEKTANPVMEVLFTGKYKLNPVR
jgi:hypothetical protein